MDTLTEPQEKSNNFLCVLVPSTQSLLWYIMRLKKQSACEGQRLAASGFIIITQSVTQPHSTCDRVRGRPAQVAHLSISDRSLLSLQLGVKHSAEILLMCTHTGVRAGPVSTNSFNGITGNSALPAMRF